MQVFPIVGAGQAFSLRPFWQDFIGAVKEEGDAPDEYEYLTQEGQVRRWRRHVG